MTELEIYLKPLIDKNAQLLTSGIKNCRDSWLFNGCSPLQLSYNLTANRPQSATFHTASRYGQVKKTKRTADKRATKLFR